MAKIDVFEMERMQSLHGHEVEYDLSESGVLPLQVDEVLGEHVDTQALLDTRLGYPRSEGSLQTREHVSEWYAGAGPDEVTIVNGGSEANQLTLWTLLESGDRLAFMVPNYMQGWGLGRHYGEATDTFPLVRGNDTWALDHRGARGRGGPEDQGPHGLQPEQPDGPRALGAGDGCRRRRRRAGRRVDRRRRDLPG